MISYIKGKIEYISEGFIIVDNGGIGYKIYVSPNLMSNSKGIGETVKIFTYMSVR